VLLLQGLPEVGELSRLLLLLLGGGWGYVRRWSRLQALQQG
jgi:hypothetical protein